TARGSITTDTDALITAKGQVASIDTEVMDIDGDITLTAATDITIGDAVATNDGNINLTAMKGSVTLNDTLTTVATADRTEDGVFADGNITVAAATSIMQNADITVANGDLTLTANAGNILQNANSKLVEGNVLLTAKVAMGVEGSGNITMRDANLDTKLSATSIEVGSGNITLTAANNVNVAAISASNDNTVTLTATQGAITGQPNTELHVHAGTLDATAGKGIGNALRTSIGKLFAKVTGIGNITIDEVDAIELANVSTTSGSFDLKAGDDVLARDVAITGAANFDVKGELTTSEANSLVMPTVPAGQIAATDLTVKAVDGVNIRTDVTTADVVLSNMGDIVINEANGITLNKVETADGDVTVSSAGAMTVAQVVAKGEDAKAILTSAEANIVQDSTAMAPAVTAANTILSASTGIGSQTADVTTPLTLKTNTLTATSTSGDIVLAQDGELSLNEVATADNVNFVITNGDLIGNDVNRLAGDEIKLTALQGSVTDINTEAGALLNVIALGDIELTEKDGITQVNLKGENVTLSSTTGDLGIGLVEAVEAVNLSTLAGAIVDADLDDDTTRDVDFKAKSLTVSAAQGVGQPRRFIETEIDLLNAETSAGGVFVDNKGDLTLDPITVAGGDVIIRTDGKLDIASDVSNIDGGNITLQATGDVDQAGDISATGRGSVSVISTVGNIDMDRDARSSVVSGVVDYQAAQTLAIGNLAATGNGTVQLTAPMITSNVPEGGNVQAFFLNVNSENVDRPFFELLLGENAVEAALLRLNMRVVGGNLANSRQFMDHLLQPLGLSTSGNGSSGQALINHANPLKSLEMNVSGQLVQSSHNTWVFQIKQ
ncbi:hypothetical protein, partial [Paraglaciecola sp.]|uniref:beta strand repeat-containing protein n=1 Tax=Paraglaciecola sp. TaxID=1920173 RepID=UPI00273F848C